MTGSLHGIEPARKRGQALPPPRPVNRSGMSLLEVLVACGILVVGLASVAAMLPAAASRLSQASAQDRSVAAAQAALVEIEARQLLSRDLFASGSAALVFGLGTPQAADLPNVGTALSRPVGVGFAQRMDNDPASDGRMYYVEDEVQYDLAAESAPTNSFASGIRQFRRGVCWGAVVLPEPWGTGTASLNAARVGIAVFQKPGAPEKFALTTVFSSSTPSAMFEAPGASMDDATRKQYLKPCSYVLAIPPSNSVAPRWLAIVSSWPIWTPGVDPQKSLPTAFRFTFRDEVPLNLLSGSTLTVIGFPNLLGVTEQVMPVY
jgi:type II secretory pathway pseudopilin PulG